MIECFLYSKNTKERSNKLRQIRNKGNCLHNTKVLEKRQGTLLVRRRRGEFSSPDDFLPCPFCYGFYFRKLLFKHAKKCPDNDRAIKKDAKIQNEALFLTPYGKNSCELFREKVLKRMRVDELTNFVKCDETLVFFGSKLIKKYEDQPHMVNEISQKLRILARLVLDMNKKHSSIKKIVDLIMPENFNKLIECVDEMYLKSNNCKPSTAIKIGNNLHHCASIILVNSIIGSKQTRKQKVEDFITLYKKEWLSTISAKAKTKIYEGKFNKPLAIPNETDVIALNVYIVTKEKSYIDHEFENVSYEDVTKNTLAHIIIFNRRRVGEVQRLTIQTYLQRQKSNNPQGEIEQILSTADKKRNSMLQRVEVRGKKGNKVPIIFTPNMIICIDFILKKELLLVF